MIIVSIFNPRIIFSLVALLISLANAHTVLGGDLRDFIGDGVPGINEKDYDSTIVHLNSEIQLNPTNSIPRLLKARIYIQQGKYDQAVAECDELILQGTNLTSLAFRGYANYGKGDYANAVSDFTKCILVKPIAPIYLIRARSFEKEGDVDKALADYDEAIILKRNDALAHYLRGNAFAFKGNFSKAIDDFDLAILIATNYSQAYSSRGLAWSKIGNYAKAIADCNQSILNDPTNAGAYNNLAWILATASDQQFRNGKKAIDYAKRACELSAWKNPYCIGTLASAYAETGNYAEAIKWETKSIQFGLPNKELVLAHERMELYEKKQPFHETLLKSEPDKNNGK